MKFVTPPPPPPPYPPPLPYPPPTPPKGSHFMNSGHLWKYQWRKRLCKGQLKSLPSPTNLLHPLKKGTLKGLVISYSLKGRVVWDAVFWFFIDGIYRYPYKALWYLIDSPHPPPPPPSICSQFSLVLLLTLLEMADSPTVPPGNHVIPPPPWKKIFYFFWQ